MAIDPEFAAAWAEGEEPTPMVDAVQAAGISDLLSEADEYAAAAAELEAEDEEGEESEEEKERREAAAAANKEDTE